MDQDEANDAICARAAIQMFGHKHRQRIQRDPEYVRFSAGAVNPDRREAGWLPGYNLVEVHLEGSGQNRTLMVDAHLRQWQSNPDMFRPVLTPQRDTVFRHTIRFPGAECREGRSAETIGALGAMSSPDEPSVSDELMRERDADAEAAMGDASTRNLVFQFWNLKTSERRDIALRLGLITDQELGIPEPERYGRALIRASERGKLEELAREIAQKETQ